MVWTMAWRNVWRNPVRSLVIMFSILLGLLAAFSVLSLYKGMMNGRKRTVIDTETSHLQIHDPGYGEDMEPSLVIQGSERLFKILKEEKQIERVAIRSLAMGMLSTTAGTAGVKIHGIDPGDESIVTRLDKKIKEGLVDPQQHGWVLMGRKLANKFRLRLGSKVVITLTDREGNLVSTALRVRGIYQSANAPLDEVNVYMSRAALSGMMGIGEGIHELLIRIKSDDSAQVIQSRLASAFTALKVETWREISPETDLMIRTVDVYSYIIVLIILVTLSFGVVNTMMMAVLERRREIGMMAALGMGGWRLMQMVMAETLLLTMTGVPLAMLVGYILIGYYTKHGIDLSGMGEDLMRSFGYEVMIYPVFPMEKILPITGMVIFCAFLSSLFPSIRTLRLKPAEALQK